MSALKFPIPLVWLILLLSLHANLDAHSRSPRDLTGLPNPCPPVDPCLLKPNDPCPPIDPCLPKPNDPCPPIDPCLPKPNGPPCPPVDPCLPKPNDPCPPIDPCLPKPNDPGPPVDPCLPKPNDPCPPVDHASAPVDPLKELYLEYHNELRERVGSSTVVWNDTLAVRAHKFTEDRSDCRDPPSDEPDINFFFSPKKNASQAVRAYYNAMDWESYAYVPKVEDCPDFFPCVSFRKIARPNVTSVGCSDNPCDDKGTLILCYYSPLLVERDLKGLISHPKEDQMNKGVYLHGFNKLRSRKKIPPLEWDDALAQKAREFVDEYKEPMACEKADEKGSPMDRYVFFSRKDDDAEEALKFMFNQVGWEGYSYDCETHTCPTGMECDHFIRIASPETVHVGCSDIQCIGNVGTLIVCHFDPPATTG